MLLGVLDIGPNSAQLQVFEARPGAPRCAGTWTRPAVRSPVAPAQRLDLRPGRAGRQARHARDHIVRPRL